MIATCSRPAAGGYLLLRQAHYQLIIIFRSESVSVSYVAFFRRAVQRSGNVPLHVAASQVGRVVDDIQQSVLVLAMLARYGECGIRRVREAVESLPLVPASLESSFGSLPDLLPLHAVLVKNWCKQKGDQVESCRTGRWATVVRSMADSLNYPFCAGISRS